MSVEKKNFNLKLKTTKTFYFFVALFIVFSATKQCTEIPTDKEERDIDNYLRECPNAVRAKPKCQI